MSEDYFLSDNGGRRRGSFDGIGEQVPFAGFANVESGKPDSPEAIERESFSQLVDMIVKHPAFSFEDSGLPAEYDEMKKAELYDAVMLLKKRIDSEHLDLEIPDRIETILAEDEDTYRFNTDYGNVETRTTYGLLCGDGATCIGFSETCCIALSLYGYRPVPVLSRLNKKGVNAHYVTCVESSDGTIRILDPERKRSCSEPEKKFSLTAYQGSLRYAVATREWSKVKMAGDRGVGPLFDEFFADKKDEVLQPIVLMMKKLQREDDNMQMYENGPSGTTRINLKQNSMSSRKKELLDNVISETMRPIYERSVRLMMGEE